MTGRTILLAAGGTGGHLFPAEALAHELIARGFKVHLATDERAKRFVEGFPATQIHIIPSATPSAKNPFKLARALWVLWRGIRASRVVLNQIRPAAVVGFGGYPTVPPVLAADGMGIAILIHDANAVMGRANRMLARRAKLVAMGFDNTAGGGRTEVVVTGNPVRPEVLEAARKPYPERTTRAPFNLLIFGGSQGAQFFADALPEAVSFLDPPNRSLLRIVQQARPEDVDRVTAHYAEVGIRAEVAPFFTDMARRIAAAHFVISRAGASTVSELAVIGRPAILVPYPHALDHDQALNARAMAQAKGAEVVAQGEMNSEWLARRLRAALANPKGLAQMAQNAKKTGRPDATSMLADCVERVASGTAARISG